MISIKVNWPKDLQIDTAVLSASVADAFCEQIRKREQHWSSCKLLISNENTFEENLLSQSQYWSARGQQTALGELDSTMTIQSLVRHVSHSAFIWIEGKRVRKWQIMTNRGFSHPSMIQIYSKCTVRRNSLVSKLEDRDDGSSVYFPVQTLFLRFALRWINVYTRQ